MLSNLYQLDRYLEEYCLQNPQDWCEIQLEEFKDKIEGFNKRVQELIENF